MFMSPFLLPETYPAFADLPVQRIAAGPLDEKLAVHRHGDEADRRPPLVCLAGFQRNMADFADFVRLFPRLAGEDWPVILIDLKGRGRSDPRRNKALYTTTEDARDVVSVLAALGVGRAFFLGQGHGGLVIEILAREAPSLVAGTILVDAGPLIDTRGLVRLKNNLADLEGRRTETAFKAMVRRALSADYPMLGDARLDVLAARTHFLDKGGRVRALFDPHLGEMLKLIEHDDELKSQWPLYDGLAIAPLLLVRTQRTDLVRRDVFEEMVKRRPDVRLHLIEGQGSPALFDTIADVEPVAHFIAGVGKARG